METEFKASKLKCCFLVIICNNNNNNRPNYNNLYFKLYCLFSEQLLHLNECHKHKHTHTHHSGDEELAKQVPHFGCEKMEQWVRKEERSASCLLAVSWRRAIC